MSGTVTYPPERPTAELDLVDPDRHRRQIAASLRLAMKGQINCSMFVTLTPGAATTTVLDARMSAGTCASLMPQTANAAAAIPTTWIVCTNGQMVLHHANNGQTDRTFTIAILG